MEIRSLHASALLARNRGAGVSRYLGHNGQLA